MTPSATAPRKATAMAVYEALPQDFDSLHEMFGDLLASSLHDLIEGGYIEQWRSMFVPVRGMEGARFEAALATPEVEYEPEVEHEPEVLTEAEADFVFEARGDSILVRAVSDAAREFLAERGTASDSLEVNIAGHWNSLRATLVGYGFRVVRQS